MQSHIGRITRDEEGIFEVEVILDEPVAVNEACFIEFLDFSIVNNGIYNCYVHFIQSPTKDDMPLCAHDPEALGRAIDAGIPFMAAPAMACEMSDAWGSTSESCIVLEFDDPAAAWAHLQTALNIE